MTCPHCNHETDNGLGFCNFCKTPFPPPEPEVEEPEVEVEAPKKKR